MSYVAIREVTPASGKEAVLQERMLRLSGVMTRLGAKSGLFKVVAGDGAGRFDLQNWYETVEAGATAFQAFGEDEEYQKIMQLRAADPVGEVVGPWIGRMIFGGAPKGNKPVRVHRDYHASRSAVQKAMELAPDVRVNGIAPAVVKTKLSEMLWAGNEEGSADLHALKKLGEPEDIASLIYFLSSDDASWITGEVVTIDGGFLL